MGEEAKRGDITIELGLYSLILALAAFLRLYALDRWPLAQGEAELAYKAWHFYWGMPGPPEGEIPLLFTGNLLSFLVFGVSDYTVRLVLALSGTAMVTLPYLLRGQLGRLGALVTSFLLAALPSLLFFSRHLGEEMAVAGCFLLAVAGLFGYLEGRRAKSLYMASGALALCLTAGAESYTMLFILLSFLFVLPALHRFGWLREEDWESAISTWQELKTRRTLRRNALVLFGGVLLLVSTSFLSNPHGLQGTLELFPRWASRRSMAANPYPWHWYLELLSVYEPLALVFGGLGAIYLAWRRRSLLAIFSAYWFLWSLLIGSAASPGEGGGIVLIVLPLILLAGMFIGHLLEGLAGMMWSRRVRLLVALSLAGFAYLMLWLVGYARGRQPAYYWQIGEGVKLSLYTWFYILLGLLFFVALFAFSWAWLGRKRALILGGAMLALFLTLFSLHASFNLNYYRGEEPVEILTNYPTSRDVVRLMGMLEELSNRMTMDRHILGVDIEEPLEGVLAWYLRDFSNLRFSGEVSLSPQTPVAVAGAESRPPAGDYVSQELHFQSFWQPKGVERRAWWAWYLFREVQGPVQTRDIVMYVME